MLATLTNYERRGLDRLLAAIDAYADKSVYDRARDEQRLRAGLAQEHDREVERLMVEEERAEFDRKNEGDRFE